MKIKFEYKKIKKENLVVAGIVLAMIILGATYFFITSNSQEEIPPGSIEQPLPFEPDKEIIINEEEIEYINDEVYTELAVYDLLEINHVESVDNFLSEIGKGFIRKDNNQDIVYYWVENEVDRYYLTEYNSLFDRVFFRYEEAVELDKLDEPSESELEEYFQDFSNIYLSNYFEYGNYNITTTREGFRIEANRQIGGVPLEVQGADSYSDYLVINSNGSILQGSFYLFEYDEKNGTDVDLLTTVQLGNVISRDDYPMVFNEGLPIGFDFPETEIENPGDYPGDYVEEIPEVTSCTATSIRTVYFFTTLSSEKLTPTYRIDCRGVVELEGAEYDVPVFIYTNAIDPEYVYVPGDLE